MIRTPWIRFTGTDWLVRLNSPRVTRTPRDDWARVKLNIWTTRRLIIETSADGQWDEAGEGECRRRRTRR